MVNRYEPSQEELEKIGELIFQNETSSNKDLLVHWNDGEDFPSLGIGHFIWYPKDYDGPFDETFPKLVDAYKEEGVALPQIMAQYEHAPWNSKEELMAEKTSPEVIELTNFLYDTKYVQVKFMYNRLLNILPEIIAAAENTVNVKAQFTRISEAKGGYYPLIDYLNFKGSGLSETESYEGYRWGLLQILEGMQGTKSDDFARLEFSTNTAMLLARRVAYSPADREEELLDKGLDKTCSYLYYRPIKLIFAAIIAK